MSEELTKLKATVDQLHDKLGSMDNVDEEVRHVLQSAVEDLHQILDLSKEPSGDGGDQHASIAQRLSEVALHYEGRHPDLSNLLGSMVDILSNMGV